MGTSSPHIATGADRLTIGRWIKKLRADLEWTQEMLADRVACATQTIHAIEGGQRRTSRDLAERIAEVLGVPSDQRDAFVRLARGMTTATNQPQQTTPATTGLPPCHLLPCRAFQAQPTF